MRAACVELTEPVRARATRATCARSPADAGPVLWPIDREAIALVWGASWLPGAAPRTATTTATRPIATARGANDGAPYDRAAARQQAPADAREFVAHGPRASPAGGVCVCALDTELLGHWWYEGVWWLEAVLDEAARQGLKLTTLDDALERHEPDAAPAALPVSQLGRGGRPAHLERTAGRRARLGGADGGAAVVRGLEATRAGRCGSCWRCSRATGRSWRRAGPLASIPRQRAGGHLEAFELALAGDDRLGPSLRGLAPDLD